MLSRLLPLALLVSMAAQASAEVTRVDIETRAAVGTSGYEKIAGTVHFAVDPAHPRNRVVADLDKAPRAASGRVEFSADLYILRPLDASRSNGIALIEVVNRGRKLMLNGFNRGGTDDPASEADLGDQFLLRRGFTLVWVGWQFDVPAGPLVGIQVPRVAGAAGTVRATVTLNERAQKTVVTDLSAYPPADPAAADNTLTVRDGPFGVPEAIARSSWRIQGNTVALDSGFDPGRVYEIAYRTSDAPVGGAGLVAFRDVSSWIKYRDDAPARAGQAIAFGSSQSGRFLRSFLYQGFNADEQDRQVFDGVMAHIAGAGRLSLNERGAIPNALGMYSATFFPYSDASQRDPASGREEGLLENDRAGRHRPKIFYTNSAVEYWGGGRAAALVHTTLDGHRDLTLPENVRFYLFSGTQHSPAQFPPQMSTGQQLANPVEYWWSMRALLVAMERWVREDVAPPASRHPQLADATLVAADRIAFPAIPGVQSPRRIEPGRDGATRLPLLVSQVDADGNELAGIRAPDVAVPLATYTGWNFRTREIGAPDQLVALLGSSIPFPKTRADREASGDPRRSIEERYTSRAQYLAEVRKAADGLVAAGYFLAEDVGNVIERAGEQWDRAVTR
ncbi:MAG: alpha/beta hydrolase domain-containing protein [Vicinamibacterales bacterium]